MLGLPIYMPADQAIPVKEVPAPAHFTRPFVRDKKLLQREQKPGVSPFLTTFAYILVLLVGLGLVALLTWGLRRISAEIGSAPPRRPRRREAPRVAPARTGRSVGAASS